MSAGRFTVFLGVVLAIWTAMHLYVFWRLGSVPWVAAHLSRRALGLLALALGASYFLARFLGHLRWETPALALEWIGSTWMGCLFLLLAAFVAVDLLTLGGAWLHRWLPGLRTAAVLAAGVLTVVGLVQGLRAPVVTRHEVVLPGLPRERDGLTLVAVSDLHLGSLLGPRWLERRLRQVAALQPDLVCVVGDFIDGRVDRVELMLPQLQTLRAPLGVWAVTGNHEFYAGLDASVRLMERAGFRVLRDRSEAVVPGLVLAGVDDLIARAFDTNLAAVVTQALSRRPPGGVVLLSHSPLRAEEASRAGAGLMISGHTHNGQLWPFHWLVRMQYPLVTGRYSVEGMTVLVGRGTGTWGPRMRLWAPAEILHVRLRAAPAAP